MVSMSTTPKPLDAATGAGGGGGGGGGGKQQQLAAAAGAAAMPAPPMAVPVAAEAEESGASWRKVRKPYTTTKSRESWTEPEHDKFLEALQLFDRDWKKIEAYVGSKTVIQIRSHAQKYFLKVQKNGTCEHLPPPRPKRKAAHPYPQKASKNVPRVPLLQQASSPSMDEGCVMSMDLPAAATNSNANTAASSCYNEHVQHFSTNHKHGVGAVAANNCSSSTESQSGTWPASEVLDKENVVPALHVMPDFAQVYSFLGSVFDPDTNGHLQRLKEMDPIDAETVLLLMRNLYMNLTSPDFEAHRRLLSSYNFHTDQIKYGSTGDLLGSTRLPFMVTSE